MPNNLNPTTSGSTMLIYKIEEWRREREIGKKSVTNKGRKGKYNHTGCPNMTASASIPPTPVTRVRT